MGLFNSLKGDQPSHLQPSATSSPNQRNPFRRSPHRTHEGEYTAPPGPPPGYPSQGRSSNPQERPEYTAPEGPPPSHRPYPSTTSEHFAAPSGPPPSHQLPDHDPPPYHDWTVIPDTSLLPPPPSLGHDNSPTGNADSYEADRAHAWCKVNTLMRPHPPTQDQINLVAAGNLGLIKPLEYNGQLTRTGPGRWRGVTRSGSRDCCLLTNYPLYFAYADAPVSSQCPKLIYFEVKLKSLGRAPGGDDSSIAIGFSAVPYPPWRMPGWERGSLAVHGDDGRRYVNDTWGGKDFATPFLVGETIGLGMKFEVPAAPPEYGTTATPLTVNAFHTRNGREAGSWNLHEQLDASNDQGIEGIEGANDLYGALGIFGGAEFEVYFQRQDWMWQGS